MSTVLQQCYAHPSLNDQIQALDAQIDKILAPLQEAIAATTSASAQVIASTVMAAVTNHDQIFNGSGVQSLDGAYADAGLKTNNRTINDANREFVANGLVSVNSTLYICNPTGAATTPRLVDVQDPDDIEYLRKVLKDPDYVDPVIDTPVAAANTTAPNYRSSTGAYTIPGVVSDLRELYKGFGSDLVALRKFLDKLNVSDGVGVVWSFMHYVTVYADTAVAPASVYVPLTFDDVRDKAQAPLYDEDINISSTKAIAAVEYHVGTQMPRSLALEQARVICRDLGIPDDPVLMCRFVRLDPAPNVRSQSPVVSTIGFDASKLGPTSFRLGISVCGFIRIIDVTGDQGSNTLFSEYTNRTVASAISRVYGDLLSVNGVGNEITFAVNQRGSTAKIAFFHVDDYDASEACGVNGLVRDQARRSGQDPALSLQDLVGIRWTGGQPVPDSLPAAALDALDKYEIADAAVTALTTGQQYWAAGAPAVHDIVDGLIAATAEITDPDATMTQIHDAVALYASAGAFMDSVSLRYADAAMIMDELGPGLVHVLSYLPLVYSIDIYKDRAAVLGQFGALAQTHIDNDGLVTARNTYDVVTACRKNRGKLSYFYTLYRYTQVEAQNLSGDEYKQNVEMLAAYTPSLYWDDTVTLTKSAPDTSMPAKANTSTSSLWSDAAVLGSNSLTSSSEDTGGALAALIAFACRRSPSICAEISKFFSGIANEFASQEERLAALLNWLGSPLTWAWSKGIAFIAMLNRIIDRAIAAVAGAQGAMSSIIQDVTGKQSLGQALDALANLNLNVYDNFGFQTRFLSCYVSGSAGLLMSVVAQQMMGMLNQYINTINDIMNALTKASQHALDMFVCLADKLSQSFEGTIAYERQGAGVYRAAGVMPVPVTFTMQCVASFGPDGLDPAMAQELSKLKQKLTTLLGMFSLQVISYNKLDDTVKTFKGFEITQSTAAGQMVEQLREQVKQKLLDLLSC